MTLLYYYCDNFDHDMIKFILTTFADHIEIMTLSEIDDIPAWYLYLLKNIEDDRSNYDIFFLENGFLPLLLNRNRLNDPRGLTPLHIIFLFKKM